MPITGDLFQLVIQFLTVAIKAYVFSRLMLFSMSKLWAGKTNYPMVFFREEQNVAMKTIVVELFFAVVMPILTQFLLSFGVNIFAIYPMLPYIKLAVLIAVHFATSFPNLQATTMERGIVATVYSVGMLILTRVFQGFIFF